MLVVSAEGMTVGLRCDQVLGIEELAPALREPPAVLEGQRLQELCVAVLRQGERVTVLLDLGRVLTAARRMGPGS